MALINATWPITLLPESCRFGRSRNAALQQSPRTLKEYVIQNGRPRWGASLEWRLQRSQIPELQWYLDGLDGYAGSVALWDFTVSRLPGTSGNGTLSAIAAIGATSIAVTGLTPSAPVTAIGDYVQVGRRLYLADSAVTATGGGTATVTLTTPLLVAAAIGAGVTLVNPACEMRLVSQDWSRAFRAGDGLHSVSADFIETVVDYD
jgi:hypothetical protein